MENQKQMDKFNNHKKSFNIKNNKYLDLFEDLLKNSNNYELECSCKIEKEELFPCRFIIHYNGREHVKNINLAFNFLKNLSESGAKINYDFVMIAGADSIFPENYTKKLLKEFEKNPNLMVASGEISGEPRSERHVRGSGRIIRKKIWSEFGRKYWCPSYYWESGILYYCQIKGYDIRGFGSIVFYSSRRTGRGSLFRYGRNYRAMGYPFFLVLKQIATLLLNREIRILVTLITGYLLGDTPIIQDRNFSKVIKKFQVKRIKERLRLINKLAKFAVIFKNNSRGRIHA